MPHTSPDRRLFCFGLGYTGRTLARALKAEGWAVAGTCQTPETEAELRADGIEALIFDRHRPLAAEVDLAGTTHLVSTVPPDGDGDPVLDAHEADIAALGGLAWVGYISTTGVYGDTGGALVDETAIPRPTNERSSRRLDAEQGWRQLWREHGVPVHLFRLSGIYGPGRSVLDRVRNGTARRIDRPRHLFSRIHVEDVATVLEASMARPEPGAAYNVCDDEAAAQADVAAYACGLLGVEVPPLIPFDKAAREMTPLSTSFWRDRRHISNRRIKDELGVVLKYPGYRTGLEAVLAAEQSEAD